MFFCLTKALTYLTLLLTANLLNITDCRYFLCLQQLSLFVNCISVFCCAWPIFLLEI